MGIFWKCSVAIVSTTIQSLGLTLQRLSHLEPMQSDIKCDHAPPDPPTPTAATTTSAPDDETTSLTDHVQPYNAESFSGYDAVTLWRTGIALFILANVFGSTVQLAVLPLVLVCTLQAFGLAANSLLAYLILKEPLTSSALAGTACVITGAVIIAGWGGNQADPDLDLDGVYTLFWGRRFMLWISFTALLMTALGRVACRLSQRHIELPHLLSRTMNSNNTLAGFIWGCLGGITSAHSLLFAKVVMSLLLRIQQHSDWQSLAQLRMWVLIVLCLTFAVSQMVLVNRGLQFVSTPVLYPLVFCVYTTTTLLNSLMLYGTQNRVSRTECAWTLAGAAVLVSGVLMLSTRFHHSQTQMSDNSGASTNVTGTAASNPPAFAPHTASHLRPPLRTGRTSSLQSLPRWPPRAVNSHISLSTLVTGNPHDGASPRFLSPAPNSPALHSPLSPFDESPLGQEQTYTSFDAISPNITNPDKIRGRPGHRVLSREQHKILRELGV